MLILARRPSEFVTIIVPACPGGCCPARRLRVGVNDIRGRSIYLAFDCPPEVKLLRDELLPLRDELIPAPVPPRGEPPALKPGVRR